LTSPEDSYPVVELREITASDIGVFFEHQLDPDSIWMAAFTIPDPSDRDAFRRRWAAIRSDPSIIKRTVLADGAVAGHVVSFERDAIREVSYWIGKRFWGQGVATGALRQLLKLVPGRPLHARAAADNPGSIRVLEKCGFVRCGTDSGFANARGEDTAEIVFQLKS
jgi:RimJ/RimL family protein N-acetyltransferase